MGQWPAVIPRGVKRNKVTCTSTLLLTAPCLDRAVGSMMTGYQPSSGSMAVSVAYSLPQRSARMSTRRAAVYPVKWQLTHQGTRRVVPYKVSIYFFKKYTNSVLENIYSLSPYVFRSSNLTVGEPFFRNSFSEWSHYFCVTARSMLTGDWLQSPAQP